jgi:RNA polymerase sigma factor (sigma-70 family)
MAVNLCLDHLRRVGRFRPLPLDEVAPVVAGDCDVAELVESTLEQDARRDALAWALERLSSEDRLLLHLRVAEELSYEAIAELLGTNAVTVGTRLYRARARLHGLVMRRLEEGGRGLR